jgi:RNA polymerase sigma-70 factor (ECF subfamily)
MPTDVIEDGPDVLLGSCIPLGITDHEIDLDTPSTGTKPKEPPSGDILGNNLQNEELSEEVLLDQIKQGKSEAMGILFRRHARKIRNIAYRILRDEGEADDLVQDVFLFLHRKSILFDASRGTAKSWIFHVTYSRAFDRRRHLNSRHYYTNQELVDAVLAPIDPREEIPLYERSGEGILGKKFASRLNAKLTTEQLRIIRLYFFEGHSFREIAEITGQSLANVRNRYYRALERIRKYVLFEKL